MTKTEIAFGLGYAPAKLAAVLAQRAVLDELNADPRTAANAALAHAVSFGLSINETDEKIARAKVDSARAAAAAFPDATTDPGYHFGQLAGRMLEAWARAFRLAFLRSSAPDHSALAAKAAALVSETAAAWTALSSELARLPWQEPRRRRIGNAVGRAPAADATTSKTFRGGPFEEIANWVNSLEIQLEGIPKQLGPDAVPPYIPQEPIPLDDFLQQAKDHPASGPIEKLMLADAGGRVAELANCPELAKVKFLQMRDQHITDSDIQALAASPYVSGLRSLSLSQNEIGPIGLEALAAASSTTLASLEGVGIQMNRVRDPADRQDTTDGVNVVYYPTAEGEALEAKYGRLRWLHPAGT